MRNVKEVVSQITLDEKAKMLTGKDFWHTLNIDRLNIGSVMVSDGPHGLRKQSDAADNLGLNDSIKAICFPTAVGTASSFDRELMTSLGETLGEECQAENVSVLLGPAVNIKRSPLCGRNFEYFSEDPYLAGELSASYINGVQSKNIGTSIKHFAVNNQEKRRLTVSAVVDDRTLHEIYFPAFETSVKKAEPWTVMCSYNRINGIYSSENDWLLNTILRDRWGFEGYVMSDWGAVNNRAMGVKHGLDLEMPSSGEYGTKKIVKAVECGELEEKHLDTACERIISKSLKYLDNHDENAVFDRDADHEKAHIAATQTMVLLKNNGILPLDNTKKIAFIGEFAKKPRYQGGGSSHINSYKVVGALEAVGGTANVVYSKGFSAKKDFYDEALAAEAVSAAKNSDIAVIFAGLPEFMESEGFDREHLNLPKCQNKLIREIVKVQPKTVVVLHNGSPVLMPWLEDVSAVLESYLGGEACGEAQIDLLFGRANPSAKLAETFPLTLADTPCFGNFPGNRLTVEHREGIFVGYRYYDKTEKDVLFPFGFGLSYTEFEYSDIKLDKNSIKKNDELKVSFKIKNTGKVGGAEIAQIYVSAPTKKAFKAPKELKQFAKVFLKAGEQKKITVTLSERSFSFFNVKKDDWDSENGTYKIMVGASSRDIRLEDSVKISGYDTEIVYRKEDYPAYYKGDVLSIGDEEFTKLLGFDIPQKDFSEDTEFTILSTFEDAKNTKWGKRIINLVRQILAGIDEQSLGSPEMLIASFIEMPLRGIIAMSSGMFTEDMANAVIDLWNNKNVINAFKTLANGGINALKNNTLKGNTVI